METEEYRLMFELEETHWWYRGLHSLLFSSIKKNFNGQRELCMLDAGCGTGYNLKCLDRYGISFGIDISEVAISYCKERGLRRIARASVSLLPFSDNFFDLVISTDVLYHNLVEDDLSAINEFHRVLKEDGVLIINLPAHEYLRRPHDERVHARHRYNLCELSNKLRDGDFEIEKISYRNMILFPVLLFSSLLNKKDKVGLSDLKAVPKPINFILLAALKIENNLMGKIDLPFGTSIFCIAKKL